MQPPERLETARLLLRKIHIEDAMILFEAYTQEDVVTRYPTWQPHASGAQTEAFVQNCIAVWEGGIRYPLVITLKTTGEIIGRIDPHREGENVGLGEVIGLTHRGQGYATEAVIAWALNQPEVTRVYATPDVENSASRRVMEKAGRPRAGLLEKFILHPNLSDSVRDSHIYAIGKHFPGEIK